MRKLAAPNFPLAPTRPSMARASPVPSGSPRRHSNYARLVEHHQRSVARREREMIEQERLETNKPVFFHNTQLQEHTEMAFAKEEEERMQRRINYLQKLESRLVKATEKDHRLMQQRLSVLADQKELRENLQEAYQQQDEYIGSLKQRRQDDRIVHQQRASETENERRQTAAMMAEEQRRNLEHVNAVKAAQLQKNRNMRNKVLRDRAAGTERAMTYLNGKIQRIRDEQNRVKYRRRVNQAKRKHAVKSMLRKEQELNTRIESFLAYRSKYNKDIAQVYGKLSAQVAKLREAQKARVVFSVPKVTERTKRPDTERPNTSAAGTNG